MTANLTIGRVGLDVDVTKVWEWSQSDTKVSVTGELVGTSVDNSLVLRQQLMGYVDSPDEDFVPVTWVDEPKVNGFYRVTSVSFAPRSDGIGVYTFSIDLEKVQGFAAPSLESVILGALRANSAGIATGTSLPWQGLPITAVGYNPGGGVTPTVTTRTGLAGTVNVFSGASNYLYNARPSFFLPPANWYDNAATLRLGTTLNVVVGRQISNLPTNWELSNGLIRLTPAGAGGGFLVEEWNGSGWVSAAGWTPLRFTVSTFVLPVPHTITVLRNSPEEVAIRLSYDSGTVVSASNFLIQMDLVLRRGSYFAQVVISAQGSYPWGIQQGRLSSSVDNQIALTGGKSTSSNFNGNRILLASASATTWYGTDSDTLALTAGGTRFDGCVGVIPGGSGASGLNTGQNLIYQYMAAQNEKVTVVAR